MKPSFLFAVGLRQTQANVTPLAPERRRWQSPPAVRGAAYATYTACTACALLMALPTWGQRAPDTRPLATTSALPTLQRTGEVWHAALPNGLTVLIRPDHRAPTAAHMLWVRVGSVDEVNGLTGVAHVLEHMMFKGTPNIKPGEYSRRIAALGGRDNAFTSRDATAYHQQIPSAALPEVMRLEADRFAHNRWDDAEFRNEIEVIKEERRQRVDDQPRALLYEQLFAQMWQSHPYRRPIIGWMNDLEHLQPDEVRQFHQRWYVPNQAAVVVAGDVDPPQVLQWAMQTYGAVPARPTPTRKPQTEAPQLGGRELVVHGAAEQPYLALAFQAPRLRDPDGQDADSRDALALMMLAAVLDGYEGARLGRALVQRPEGQRLADSAGAGYSGSGRGPAVFILDAIPAAQQDPKALALALREQVQAIARDGVTATELQRVKNQWRASDIYKLDAVFAQARELGAAWVNGWPVDAHERLRQSLMRVTPEAVQAVAQRYFDAKQMTQALLLPDPEALAERRKAATTRPRLSGRH